MVETKRPATLQEALEIMAASEAMPFAGGTDLMVKRRSWAGTLPRFELPAVFLGGIRELTGVRETDSYIAIGAMEKLAALLECPLTPPILKQAVALMAGPAVRNMATIGGNICNASPAGDTLPPLYALDAEVVLQSVRGERAVPIHDYIRGPGQTARQSGELLREIRIPKNAFSVVQYRKVGARRANALSKLSFAGLYRVKGGMAEDVRIALGAVAPVVVRSAQAENMIMNKLPAREILSVYSELIRPIDDQRSSAAYRKTVSLRLIEEFIKQLYERGGEET